jgi:hypothetical protein
MEEVFITIAVFGGILLIIKSFTDFLLKRKLINSGHIDKAGILEAPKLFEENSYPTLKWGLITLFGGIALMVVALVDMNNLEYYHKSFLEFGIVLIGVSIGFLLYFFIMRVIKK